MDNISRIEIKKHLANSQNFISKTGKPCCPRTGSSLVDRVLFLQRTAGNQAVQNFIRSGKIQTKLRIGAPGDVYEQEADRVADAVMRMPEPQLVSRGTPVIQRACPKCQEEEGIQAKAVSSSLPEVDADVESGIQSVRGGGKPLSVNERAFFELRFGYDLSSIRIHTDAPAVHLASALDAHAFTLGHDVFFGAGQYTPQTERGKTLMAHELLHVIQQRSMTKRIQRNYKPLLPPGDCTYAEHRALQDNVNTLCKVKRACDQNEDCATIMKKIQANADCIKARVIINAKCFRGGDPGHILAVAGAIGALGNCWAVYNRKCQVKTPPPVPVPVPAPAKNPQPVVNKSFMEKMAAITGLTGTALVIYLIISEGSRLFPLRNLVPVP